MRFTTARLTHVTILLLMSGQFTSCGGIFSDWERIEFKSKLPEMEFTCTDLLVLNERDINALGRETIVIGKDSDRTLFDHVGILYEFDGQVLTQDSISIGSPTTLAKGTKYFYCRVRQVKGRDTSPNSRVYRRPISGGQWELLRTFEKYRIGGLIHAKNSDAFGLAEIYEKTNMIHWTFDGGENWTEVITAYDMYSGTHFDGRYLYYLTRTEPGYQLTVNAVVKQDMTGNDSTEIYHLAHDVHPEGLIVNESGLWVHGVHGHVMMLQHKPFDASFELVHKFKRNQGDIGTNFFVTNDGSKMYLIHGGIVGFGAQYAGYYSTDSGKTWEHDELYSSLKADPSYFYEDEDGDIHVYVYCGWQGIVRKEIE